MEQLSRKFLALWARFGLTLGPDGVPYPNGTNIELILSKIMSGVVWVDHASKSKCVLTACPTNLIRHWTKKDDLEITLRLTSEYGFVGLTRPIVAKVIRLHAWIQTPPKYLRRDLYLNEDDVL